MGDWIQYLKPRPDEIEALARREADPREYPKFEPIARGPAFAVLALAAVGLAALPGCVLRIAAGIVRSGATRR